jgi:hypothetical protein
MLCSRAASKLRGTGQRSGEKAAAIMPRLIYWTQSLVQIANLSIGELRDQSRRKATDPLALNRFSRKLYCPMPRLIAIALLLVAAAPLRAAYQTEHIVVSGGVSLYQWEKFKNPPHDRWWGNFIRPAVTRFQEIKAADPNARMTWLVYRPAYERRLRQNEGPLTSWISETASKYGARLIWFNSPDRWSRKMSREYQIATARMLFD